MELLSQKEIEYLRSPKSFSADYSYVLKHKIKNKVKTLHDELMLLKHAGLLNLTEFSKLTENSKSEISSNQASFVKTRWTGGDLNPRPLECKSSVHTN